MIYFLFILKIPSNFEEIGGFAQLIGISLLFGLVLSIPVFILMSYFLYYFSNKLNDSIKIILLSVLGFTGTFSTFAIVDTHSFFHFSKALFFPLTYALVLVITLY